MSSLPPQRKVRLPPPPPRPFGDYIVYVDESGDHGMESNEPTYPMFVLAFCIFLKSEYIEKVAPAVQAFKFKHFGHDMAVLHEREIRKAISPFAFLTNAEKRMAFTTDLSQVIENANFTLIATAIRKEKLKADYANPSNPYHIALKFGLERVAKYLVNKGQSIRINHVVFERRGKAEDSELELEFRRICSGANYRGESYPLEIVFASKQVNSCGLQFADLIARPIGRHLLDGCDKPNRAYEIIEKKFDRGANNRVEGYGLKCFP